MAGYIDTFFAEKELEPRVYDVVDSRGLAHVIPSEVVIEAIRGTVGDERQAIIATLRKLDFHNADIHHYLAHLARGLAESYNGVLRQ